MIENCITETSVDLAQTETLRWLEGINKGNKKIPQKLITKFNK